MYILVLYQNIKNIIMVDSSQLKIKFDDLQKYMEIHDNFISYLVKQEKEGKITREELEKQLP